jgi:hypothetical protein
MFFEQSVVNAVVTAGAWNEKGMVKNLDRSGFTPNKCGAEFIANSYDARATYTKFQVTANSIKLIDNGKGVGTKEDFVNIFEISRENHSGDRSMGVSGNGGNTGGYQFSKNGCGIPSTEIIFTRAKNGPYLKASRPWGEICRTECYTGKVTITSMTEEEIAEFNKDRENDEEKHGFTRKWEYSDSIAGVLDVQFDKELREKLNSNERWDLIFGKVPIDICLDKSDGTVLKVLPKYDYFGGEDNKYYTGINIEIIHHYTDDKNDNRFVWEDPSSNINYEIKKRKKVCDRELSTVIIHPSWKYNGTIEIYNGMRKNPKIFDEQSTTPRELCSAECFISSYEESHFHLESQKDKIRDYLGEARLYRNGQAITGFRLEGYNSSTARAGAQGMLKSFHHRTEIQYTTLSTQNNPTDNVFGIQSNKNQNQNVLPENLERLICKLKKRNFDKIETHFNEVINHAKEAKRLAAEAKKQAAAALRQQTRVVLEVEEEVEEDEVKDEVNDKKDESQVLDIVQEDPKVEQDDDFDHFEDASDDDAKQEEPKQEEQKQEPNLEPKQQLEEQNQEEKEEEEEPEQVPLITKQLLLRLLDEKINENTDESKIMVIYNLLNNM